MPDETVEDVEEKFFVHAVAMQCPTHGNMHLNAFSAQVVSELRKGTDWKTSHDVNSICCEQMRITKIVLTSLDWKTSTQLVHTG